MKAVRLSILLLALVTATGHLSATEISKENVIRISKVQPDVWVSGTSKQSDRFKRQTETTTPKPKKPRPSNIFSLISVLLTETRDDANRAFNEIGTLFNSQFANGTTKKEPSTTTTTPSPSSSSSDSDEDNEITTTTEAFRITRDEFLGILRSNVQGIRNLFGKEFRVAIKDSNQNVREFGRGLGVALRPYFNNNYNSTKSSSRSNIISANGSTRTSSRSNIISANGSTNSSSSSSNSSTNDSSNTSSSSSSTNDSSNSSEDGSK